jgi:hypothetical protein
MTPRCGRARARRWKVSEAKMSGQDVGRGIEATPCEGDGGGRSRYVSVPRPRNMDHIPGRRAVIHRPLVSLLAGSRGLIPATLASRRDTGGLRGRERHRLRDILGVRPRAGRHRPRTASGAAALGTACTACRAGSRCGAAGASRGHACSGPAPRPERPNDCRKGNQRGAEAMTGAGHRTSPGRTMRSRSRTL